MRSLIPKNEDFLRFITVAPLTGNEGKHDGNERGCSFPSFSSNLNVLRFHVFPS